MNAIAANINETAPAKATAAGRIFVSTGANAVAERVIDSTVVATAETTVSTSYAALATAGPAVTVTTGARALVFLTALIANNSIGQKSYVGCAVSSATTIAAADTDAMEFQVYGSNAEFRGTTAILYKTLTPGSNVFTMQYRTTAGTATYTNRVLTVIAL